MTEPLSVAAGVTQMICLALHATKTLAEFYNSYKDLNSDISTINQKLDCLLKILDFLKSVISDRDAQKDEDHDLVQHVESAIKACGEAIEELQNECKKLTKAPYPATGFKAAAKLTGRRATYPFRTSTLQKLGENIDDIHSNIATALNVLQLRDNKRLQDTATNNQSLLNLVLTNQLSSELYKWLRAPDATVEHNEICSKRKQGTGLWLIRHPRFLNWLTEGNSILWLSGFAGSGKSMLCSTAIESLPNNQGYDSRTAIAFFYFTMCDRSKQDASAMLRAMLLQLSSQLPDGHADLVRLYELYRFRIVPLEELLECLRSLVLNFLNTFILLDGLDESPRDGPRERVLDALETIRSWEIQGLHVFITSRNERDIDEALDLSTGQKIRIRDAATESDISEFIAGSLEEGRSLQKWRNHRNKIQESLARRAKGAFRWVECQLKSLQSSPCSPAHLDRLLSSLPPWLDDTYERILCDINEGLVNEARRILTLLCFAFRPLKLYELLDGIAVDIDHQIGLNKESRLEGGNDLLDICSGLIDIDSNPTLTDKAPNAERLLPTVRLAHFSVQEYLESDRIRHGKAAVFSLNNITAHAEIARVCLIYLLEPDLSHAELHSSTLKEYPLAVYAATHWYNHYRLTQDSDPVIHQLILRLFKHKPSFENWVKLHDVEQDWVVSPDLYRTSDDIPSPVYYAALLGLETILSALLNVEDAEDRETSIDPELPTGVSTLVNVQGGYWGNPLSAASYRGYEQVIHILLANGASVDSESKQNIALLYAASYGGHEKVVRLLFDNGADVNMKGRYGSTPLHAATSAGHMTIAQFLLDHDADINAQSIEYGTALQAASIAGQTEIVRLLLARGVDTNARGGLYSNALCAASLKGHSKIVQLLLDGGADITTQHSNGSALCWASRQGNEEIVELLLDRGAHICEQKRCSNALYWASFNGYTEIVQLLLGRGADINAQGDYGDALQAALDGNHADIVELLEEERKGTAEKAATVEAVS